MTTRNWYVIETEKDGNYFAFPVMIPHCYDLVEYAKEAHRMNACATKKQAIETAAAWNENYDIFGVLQKGA